MFILDHNFWSRNAEKSIKGSKYLDSSLVSNENFNKILWPRGWALGQATWAKWPKNYFTFDVSQKICNPKPKVFLQCRLEDCWSIWAFEQLFSAVGSRAMALVRQWKTAGFRLKSRYDIFVEQPSKCWVKRNKIFQFHST